MVIKMNYNDHILWKLFKATGDIKYYLMYKEMEKEDAESEDQGDNNIGDQL